MSISPICSLPEGVHNARPFLDGVIFNDTKSDVIRYISRSGNPLISRYHLTNLKSLNLTVLIAVGWPGRHSVAVYVWSVSDLLLPVLRPLQ